jgi:hypothetical protein
MDNAQSMMGSGHGNLQAAMANFHQQYSQNPASAPVEQAASLFHQWAQTQPTEQVNAMAEEALGHLPHQQQQEVASALLDLFHQNGLNPQMAGVQAGSAQAMSMGDVAKMVGYVQQNQPNLLQKLLSNRLVRMVVLAILAYEANKLMRGYASGGSAPSPGATTPAPAQPHESFADHVRNFLTGLLPGSHTQTQPPDTTSQPPYASQPPYVSQPPDTSPPPYTGGGVSSVVPPETVAGIQDNLRGASDMHGSQGTHHGRHLGDENPNT